MGVLFFNVYCVKNYGIVKTAQHATLDVYNKKYAGFAMDIKSI